MGLTSFLRLMAVTVFQVKVLVHGGFGFSPFGETRRWAFSLRPEIFIPFWGTGECPLA